MNTPTEPIAVDLLGSGNFMRSPHLKNFLRHPGFSIRGVADPNLESAKGIGLLAELGAGPITFFRKDGFNSGAE